MQMQTTDTYIIRPPEGRKVITKALCTDTNELNKCRDKRPGQIAVNSEDTIMPIHAQKAIHY